MPVVIQDFDTQTRVVEINKEELVEIMKKNVESLKLPTSLGEELSYQFECWNYKGTKTCSDISKVIVTVQRRRSF